MTALHIFTGPFHVFLTSIAMLHRFPPLLVNVMRCQWISYQGPAIFECIGLKRLAKLISIDYMHH